jgi:hypothetical protein
MGFIYSALASKKNSPYILFGKIYSILTQDDGVPMFTFSDTALRKLQPLYGDFLMRKFRRDESDREWDSAGWQQVTIFIPDTLLKGKQHFTVGFRHFPRTNMPAQSNFNEVELTGSGGPSAVEIHIRSTPDNCKAYKINQDDYDIDTVFRQYGRNNFKVDARFLDHLTRYIIVGGRTNVDVTVDKSNSVIFIRNGDKLSPPLKCTPKENGSNIVKWGFK